MFISYRVKPLMTDATKGQVTSASENTKAVTLYWFLMEIKYKRNEKVSVTWKSGAKDLNLIVCDFPVGCLIHLCSEICQELTFFPPYVSCTKIQKKNTPKYPNQQQIEQLL